MALMPKRLKHRKWQRGRLRGKALRGNHVHFGEFGLQCLELGHITGRQIEAARVAAARAAREAKLFIRIFPHRPVTSTPAETRMGKGKGEPEYYAAAVRPGMILYELSGITEEQATLACNRMSHKLPVRVRMVKRGQITS